MINDDQLDLVFRVENETRRQLAPRRDFGSTRVSLDIAPT
jgi:hypothetical protein